MHALFFFTVLMFFINIRVNISVRSALHAMSYTYSTKLGFHVRLIVNLFMFVSIVYFIARYTRSSVRHVVRCVLVDPLVLHLNFFSFPKLKVARNALRYLGSLQA